MSLGTCDMNIFAMRDYICDKMHRGHGQKIHIVIKLVLNELGDKLPNLSDKKLYDKLYIICKYLGERKPDKKQLEIHNNLKLISDLFGIPHNSDPFYPNNDMVNKILEELDIRVQTQTLEEKIDKILECV